MKKHWWIVMVLVLALAVPAVANQAVKIIVDGQELKSDVPAQIIDGRTMVPLRAVAEYFGKTAEWDQDTYTATIAGKSNVEKVSQVVAEVAVSPHKILKESVDREGACNACHSGTGFANKDNPDFVYVVGEHKDGLSCETCHSGNGKEALDSGEVELPFMTEAYQGGAGALCMNCHNGRRDTEADFADVTEDGFRNSLSYPHYANAAALYTGEGGMEIPELTYEKSFGHPNMEDSCVTCHMPQTEDGFRSHEWNMDDADLSTCGSCHGKVDSFDINGTQTKVTEMKDKLKKAAIAGVPGAVELTTGHGQIIFLNADGEEIPAGEVPQDAYVAAFNYKLIDYDGSKGVHNPKYAKSLLLNSYKNLTGEDMAVD